MKLRFPIFIVKKRAKDEVQKQDAVNSLVDIEPVKPIASPERLRLSIVRGDVKLLETYPLYEPWAYAYITEDLKAGTINYVVYEIGLTPQEESVYKSIVDYIMWELEPPKTQIEDVRGYISSFAKRAIRLFQLRLGRTPGLSWSKIGYYIERNIIGYSFIDPLMRDPNIEDISCNGPNLPVYVWHRKYEYLPTSVVFRTSQELDEFVIKLAHLASKHISVAYPVLDAILPGGHRIAATFQKEVSTKGSTFTIRKFREDPITIVDLISYGTISPETAAYFWLAMDYKMTTLILGVTGAGKTSTLNALANLLRPTYKIVTIEDTPELRLPQENWVQLTSRPSYLVSGVTEIKLFDLVKISLRYRPDVVIVGEVRGEEAYVLFQAIATGHSGITTIHAEDIDAAVKRLTSPPMNIPSSYIPLVNMALVIKRVTKIDETGRPRPVRRITAVWEVEDYGKYREFALWDPLRDRFKVNLRESVIIEKIAKMKGLDAEDVIEDVVRRKSILNYLVATGKRSYEAIATYVYNYYYKPAEVLKEIGFKEK
ncbi:MAG: type II/IV secretion system ATPase subunit [Sulfolobales archaeon]|nr:type II/IV secretion system ATPase subunit [Sulfolobales archaeon]MDW8082371.1 type II/IV secretion system ATPase subunit [Sulfolobales archaeon]